MLLTLCVVLAMLVGLVRWLLQPDVIPKCRLPPADTDFTQRPGLLGMMRKHAPATGLRYVVIGGTGSVGLRLVEALIERGETRVVSFDINPRPKRRPAGATFVTGNVGDYASVRAVCEGADVVFATFALIKPHERLACLYAPCHAVNVVGTENVVRACIEAGVPVLVQTSTSNVCVAPALARPQMDENSPCARLPASGHIAAAARTCSVSFLRLSARAAAPAEREYRARFLTLTCPRTRTVPTHCRCLSRARYVDPQTTANHYSWTKAQAERAVLAAHGSPLPSRPGCSLATASIRPCSALIGPDDVNICERWLKRGSAVVTAAGATIDWVCVDDVVYAHLLAERRLREEPRRVGECSAARAHGLQPRAVSRVQAQACPGRNARTAPGSRIDRSRAPRVLLPPPRAVPRVGGQAYCVSQDEPASFEQVVCYVKSFYDRVSPTRAEAAGADGHGPPAAPSAAAGAPSPPCLSVAPMCAPPDDARADARATPAAALRRPPRLSR